MSVFQPPPERPERPDNSDAPKCDHVRKEARKVIQSNGVVVGRWQCLTCGSNEGVILKSQMDPNPLPLFDKSISERWWEKYRAHQQKKHEAFEAAFAAQAARWWAWYDSYLRSPQWHHIRAKVLARDKGICCGCGVNRAVQVHHLHYRRVGREMLFDLVSICLVCHEQIHENRNVIPVS